MAVAGFYRRALPSPPAIEFASPQGKQLFIEALEGGTMDSFFKLISCYQTQSEPAYCGLASLAMVLNALAIDPGRTWKGPWRWFDDSMLDCCEPLVKIKEKGITFGKVACLAHCNAAKVETFRTNEITVDGFRRFVVSCNSSEDCYIISSYHRGTFKQTGSGHFSPIGGYHAGKDMVLILDVARFIYPPHWVPLELLWEAMNTIDEATRHHGGFMILSKLDKASSILYTLTCRHEGWSSVANYLSADVPHLLKSEDVKDVEEVLSVVFKSPPADLREFIEWVAEVRRQDDGGIVLSEEKGSFHQGVFMASQYSLFFKSFFLFFLNYISLKLEVDIHLVTLKFIDLLLTVEEVLKQVRGTELFKYVTRWLISEISTCKGSFSSHNNELPEIAANVCCQGAKLFTGNFSSLDCMVLKKGGVKFLKSDGEKPVTVLSGTLFTDDSEQGVDILVPLSRTEASSLCDLDQNGCHGFHPSAGDVLTVLIFSLHQNTWSNIKDEKLQAEINSLVSIDNVPPLLQEEVLQLRRQLHFLTIDLGLASAS
uniref:glutathione gamma-glutamylcysteinyltransferase n=1 Tax=Salix viminalis TaxID=40686 RepID=A0A6N2LAB7_SALVM